MRYGLRRQLILNLGLVMLLSSLLLSFFAMHMMQFRFIQDRTRYLRIVSEQIDQSVLLSIALEQALSKEKPLLQRRNPFKGQIVSKAKPFIWMPELGTNGTLWPTDAAIVYRSGKIRDLMGLPPPNLQRRLQRLQKKEMREKRNPQSHRVPSLAKGVGLPMSSDVQWFRLRLTQRVVWERYRTLFRKGKRVGTLWLRWDIGAMRKEFYTYQGLLFLYLILFCLLILFVVMLFLEGRLVRPLNRLGKAMSGLPEGRTSSDLGDEVSRRDQIGDVARAFLAMSDILRQQSHEREKHIQELESANKALERAQEELVQREKLATVGSLAAGVAHEVGNPLSAIMGYSDLLQGSKEWGELERDLVERISGETKRIDRIIRDLLDYARPVRQDKSGDPVNSVKEALELLRLQQRFRDMQVETVWQTPLPLVRLSESYLIQVLINILLNAADACGGTGRITVRVFTVETFVVIEITDSGPGIPFEVRETLFEPFVTTKDPGKGVGLGLALCRRLVAEAGGRLEVGDAVDGGAVFSIALPADAEILPVEDEKEESESGKDEEGDVEVQVVTTSSEAWVSLWEASESESPEANDSNDKDPAK